MAERYIREFHVDMDRLGVLRADHEPRCTEHIPEMLALTRDLIAKGHAYTTLSGDVYFRVRSFEPYGSFRAAHRRPALRGRIQPGEEKEDPLDFACGRRPSRGAFLGQPWGKGRPGWHRSARP